MHMIAPHSIAAWLLAGLLLAGCGGRQPDVPVTPEAALPVVRAIAASVEAGNRDFFNHKLDSAAFVERATRALGLSGLEQSMARTGMFSEVNLGEFVVDDVDRGGSYRFLRLHTVDGETRALVRIITAAGELNYHDIVLGYRGRSNDVAVRDVFVYKTGELMSRSFSTIFEQVIGDDDRPAASHAPGMLEALDTMTQLAKKGSLEESRAYYRLQPPEFRRSKVALDLYLTLSSLESVEEYHKAVDEYLGFYSNDTGSAMLRVELGLLEGTHQSTLGAIDNLAKIVGGDPYLDALRARVMALTGDLEGASALARKAVDAEPDLPEIYWPHIDILVARGRDAEAIEALRALQKNGGVEREKIEMEVEIKTMPGYDKFLASREYAAWSRE